MKPRQRQAAILEHLQSQGKCSVEELAQHFDTTGTTIRKDLVILENAGTVIRTYGGVVLNKDDADQHPQESADCRGRRTLHPRWRFTYPRRRQYRAADGAVAEPLQ